MIIDDIAKGLTNNNKIKIMMLFLAILFLIIVLKITNIERITITKLIITMAIVLLALGNKNQTASVFNAKKMLEMIPDIDKDTAELMLLLSVDCSIPPINKAALYVTKYSIIEIPIIKKPRIMLFKTSL